MKEFSVAEAISRFIRRQGCTCLGLLACATGYVLDWLEEFHGNLLDAQDTWETEHKDV